MKRELFQLGLLLAAVSVLPMGCATRHYEPVVATSTGGEVVVTEVPPAPRHEVIGVAPSTAHVWIPGHWRYRYHRWVWVPGYYEARPRPAAVWVPGHWDHTSRGWVWTPGHWD
jgi:hypothetical protein